MRGTKQLLDHCAHYGVQKLVVVSSWYVYGAFPENPFYMDEDSPLSASRNYPEIRDLVGGRHARVDTSSGSTRHRAPACCGPVNVLGYFVPLDDRAVPASMERIPTMMGFDPMMQFIHEEDVSEAIALALEHGLQGVFNVTGPGRRCRCTRAIRETGGTRAAAAGAALRALVDRAVPLGLQAIPPGALDYIKYPVTVSGERFVEATNFRPLFGLSEIFQSVTR